MALTGGPSDRRRVTFFVFVTVFLDMIGFGIILPLLPIYVRSMGGSPSVIGFVFAVFSVTQFFATPWLGRLSDRVGRRPVILISLAGNALAMFVFAIGARWSILALLFVSRTIAGATAGNLSACQAAVADVTTREDRAAAMGLVGAATGLGLAVGPVLGGVFSQWGPWAPPVCAAVLATLDCGAAIAFFPETREARREPAIKAGHHWPFSSVAELARERLVLVVAGLFFLTFIAVTNLQVALALLAHERFGWGAEEVGHVFGLFGFTSLVTQIAAIGPLSRKFGARRLSVVGPVLIGLGMGLIGVSTSAGMLFAGVAAIGAGMGVAMPVLSTLASELAGPARQGAVLGFTQAGGGLARALGPILGGVLYSAFGSSAPFAGGAAASLASTACALAFVARSKTADVSGVRA